MDQEFSFKQLYQVVIKATQNIEINGKKFSKFETVAAFDKISIANFNQIKNFVSANGGFENRARVWWETTKQVRLNFVQGIFSRQQFALMNNTKTIKRLQGQTIIIHERQIKQSDEDGLVQFSHIPVDYLFIYDKQSGELFQDYEVIDQTTIKIEDKYKELILDYSWEYLNGGSDFIIGKQITHGTFVLFGRTKVKDDITGQVKTGIITVPKLKLMSDLSMRLGQDANPIVGRLDAIACPIGDRSVSYVMDIKFLNDYIEEDRH